MSVKARILELPLKFSVSEDSIHVALSNHVRDSVPLGNGLDTLRTEWQELRKGDGPSMEQALQLGSRLADTTVPPSMQDSLQTSLRRAAGRNESIQVSICLPDISLSWAPWELLAFRRRETDDVLDGILALHPGLRLVRRIGEGQPPSGFPASGLKVLAIQANPSTSTFPSLGWLAAEQRALAGTFRAPHSVRSLYDAVPSVLRRALVEFEPDIVHYSGHCERRVSDSYLVLPGTTQAETFLSATEFGSMVAASSAKVVILNACESAGWPNGVAERLVEAGIGVVIGNQGYFGDASGPDFSRRLYQDLLDGATIDEAVALYRQAVSRGSQIGFGPVVYVNSPIEPIRAYGSEGSVPGNLPETEPPLIGRVQELGELIRGLKNDVRLMSITGAGGIGKSLLARHAARSVSSFFPDGIWIIPCADIGDQDSLYFAVASTLNIGTRGADSLIGAVKEYVSRQTALLIFDCCEGLVASGASEAINEIGSNLRGACLVTSRTRLGSPGEAVVPLGILPVAEGSGIISDSAKLFLQAAQLSLPRLSDKELATVEEIGRTLEGVPLAIQLAGNLHEILGLKDLLKLLRTSQLKTFSPLSSAIQRSLSLISSKDQHLLWQITVFVGTFTFSDFCAVIGDDAHSLLGGLTQVAGQGLVIVERGRDNDRRYRILDSVREFMAARIQTEEMAEERRAARERHCNHFVSKSRELSQLMRDERWDELGSEIWRSIGNCRAALAFAVANGRDADVATLADSLTRPYCEAGLHSDFSELADRGRKAFASLGDRHAEIRLLGLLGAAAIRNGSEMAGRDYWHERARIAMEVGDHVGAADSYIDLAVQFQQAEELDEAERLLSKAEEHLEQGPNIELSATISIMRASNRLKMGDIDAARSFADIATDQVAASERQDRLLFVHLNLGRTWKRCEDPCRAAEHLAHSLAGARPLNRFILAGLALIELAEVFEGFAMNESAYLCLVCAERLLKQAQSKYHGRSCELLEKFSKQKSALVSAMASEVAAASTDMMLDEAIFRARTLSEPPTPLTGDT